MLQVSSYTSSCKIAKYRSIYHLQLFKIITGVYCIYIISEVSSFKNLWKQIYNVLSGTIAKLKKINKIQNQNHLMRPLARLK